MVNDFDERGVNDISWNEGSSSSGDGGAALPRQEIVDEIRRMAKLPDHGRLTIFDRLRRKHPGLTQAQVDRVLRG